jgi:hypothetical protein
MPHLKKLFLILVYIFAAVGFFLVAGYFAVRFGLTNEAGIIDEQREAFFGTSTQQGLAGALGSGGLPAQGQPNQAAAAPAYVGPWQQSQEWKVMEEAIRRDEAVIRRAATDSGVSPRLIIANLVAEQLRLFFTEREAYKKWFYPLKILGPQSQFSWGVMGMKEATAVEVERNLKDPASPYYLGAAYEHRLDFSSANVQGERFTRMTDQHDHYWSYLYAGLFMNQVMTQWRSAGHPIDGRPEIVSTLYNIGFRYSVPKADPQVGGAAIPLSDGTHSFGGLAAEFYNSDLLTDIFPR